MTDEQPTTAAGRALYDSLRRGVVFVVARKADGSEFPDYALPAILAIEAEARQDGSALPSPALAETMTRLADGPRSKWHDEVLPNGAGESWVCVPIGDVLAALPPSAPAELNVDPNQWQWHGDGPLGTREGAGDGWWHLHPDGTRWVHPKQACEYARLQEPER